jgi:hypothetical protein
LPFNNWRGDERERQAARSQLFVLLRCPSQRPPCKYYIYSLGAQPPGLELGCFRPEITNNRQLRVAFNWPAKVWQVGGLWGRTLPGVPGQPLFVNLRLTACNPTVSRRAVGILSTCTIVFAGLTQCILNLTRPGSTDLCRTDYTNCRVKYLWSGQLNCRSAVQPTNSLTQYSGPIRPDTEFTLPKPESLRYKYGHEFNLSIHSFCCF